MNTPKIAALTTAIAAATLTLVAGMGTSVAEAAPKTDPYRLYTQNTDPKEGCKADHKLTYLGTMSTKRVDRDPRVSWAVEENRRPGVWHAWKSSSYAVCRANKRVEW